MAGLGVGVILLATPTAGYSATKSLPAGTTVSGNLMSGTDMIFKGIIEGEPITVTCTSFTSSGKVPKTAGYRITLSAPPKITKCKDDLGGRDTITDNSTNGKWTLTENKAAPYTMTLSIPKAGSTFSSSLLPTCVITAAPTAADPVKGSYNDTTGTDKVSSASIPTTGSGCTSGTATISATVVLTPNPGVPPF